MWTLRYDGGVRSHHRDCQTTLARFTRRKPRLELPLSPRWSDSRSCSDHPTAVSNPTSHQLPPLPEYAGTVSRCRREGTTVYLLLFHEKLLASPVTVFSRTTAPEPPVNSRVVSNVNRRCNAFARLKTVVLHSLERYTYVCSFRFKIFDKTGTSLKISLSVHFLLTKLLSRLVRLSYTICLSRSSNNRKCLATETVRQTTWSSQAKIWRTELARMMYARFDLFA